MKDSYHIVEDGQIVAMVFLTPWMARIEAGKNYWWLNKVFVPRYPKGLRGNGFGTQILKTVLEDAGREQATLFLGVDPDHDCPLTRRDLRRWYKRYGFIHYRGNIMRRKPNLNER